MTFAELNEVRALKKKIAAEQQKISALRESLESITPKYTREKNHTALDVSPKSKTASSRLEVVTAMIIDTESAITELQARLSKAVPELTEKILAMNLDNAEQTLLIYRYVACKYFRDIGFLMGYSENWIYWKHNQILKKIRVD